MNKVRPKSVLIRLSESELDRLRKDIADSGMTQQDYLLSKIFTKEKVLSPVIAPNENEQPSLDENTDDTVVLQGAITSDSTDTKEDDVKHEMICPRCGGKLILRKGRNGKFWGCSNFNRGKGCHYTESYRGDH